MRIRAVSLIEVTVVPKVLGAVGVMALVMTPIVLFGAKAANGQTAVQSIPNTLEIRDLACATATSCVAVGLHELPNNGGGEGAVVPITDEEAGVAQIVPGVSDLFGVACYTSSNCLAVGGALERTPLARRTDHEWDAWDSHINLGPAE